MDKKLSDKLVVASVVIAVLVVIASLLGLFYPEIYAQETDNWRMQAQGQDIGNLLAVIVLLASAYGLHRQSFKAYLVWIGVLFYLLYAYIVYAVAVHFGSLFLVYAAVLGVVFYSLLYAFISNTIPKETGIYAKARARTAASYVLIGTGVLFALLWLSEIIPALIAGNPPASLVEAGLIVNPIHAIDLSVVLPGMIITGILAKRGNYNGLFFVVPWLVFTALMGASIVAAMFIILVASTTTNVVVPTLMVTVVVLLSIVALYYFMAKIRLIKKA